MSYTPVLNYQFAVDSEQEEEGGVFALVDDVLLYV
jgi:hypothetical protein